MYRSFEQEFEKIPGRGLLMNKSWLLTYNNEKGIKQNEKDFGVRNPILAIEDGVTSVLTGSVKHIKDFEIGDTAYIYGGGTERRKKKKNGIYTIGTVESFVDSGENCRFAMIKINKKGLPLINGSDLYGKLKKHLIITGLFKNPCKLDKNITDFIDAKLKNL